MDHCFPEYDVWTQFINTDLGRALELDALDNSHPIEVSRTLTLFIPSNYRGINLSGPSNFQCRGKKRVPPQNELEKKKILLLLLPSNFM